MIQTKLIKDNDAFALLISPIFQNEWKNLAAKSMGFTQMQEADFLTTWYQNYRAIFEPIFIISRNSKNEMVGLISLAWQKEKKYLVHAGSAEYHGWLASEEATIPFLKDMLHIVKNELKVEKWSWNWMPSGLDAAILQAATNDEMLLLVEEEASPIWQLDNEEKLNKLLKSKSLKSKFNRYKKRGEYRYEIITDPDRIREVLEIAKYQCDLRREAINNSRPFTEDPFKIDFCSELMNFSNKLHVSAIWLDDQLLAYHMGVEDGERVCFGLISYDPSESKQSPGTLLIIELAKHLKESGYKILDMTPGTNSYKDRFANFYETLYRPTIYFSKKSYLKAKVKKSLAKTGKKLLAMTKVDTPTMRKWKTNLEELPSILKNISLRNSIYFIGNVLLRKDVHFLYEVDLKNEEAFSKAPAILHQQKYLDLLDYQGGESFPTRRDLLIDALGKFTKGDILFSQNKNRNLQWLGWLKEVKGKMKLNGFPEVIEVDGKMNLLCDFYTSPEVSSNVFNENILTMLHETKNTGNEKVLLWVKEKDKFSQKKLEYMKIKSYKKYTSLSVLYFFEKNNIVNINS